MGNRRQRKKQHRRFLDRYLPDLCLVAPWRQQLLLGQFNEPYVLDALHTAELPAELSKSIRDHRLQFEIAKVPACEAESWLSEGGMMIFRYRSREFPSVVAYSGNNPEVL